MDKIDELVRGHITNCEEIQELKTCIQGLEAYKADIENACKTAMDEKCTLDEKHCTCVPLLRLKVKELEAENEKLQAEIRVRKRIIDRLPLCPDHRDKIRVACVECENEKLRRALRDIGSGITYDALGTVALDRTDMQNIAKQALEGE